MLSKALSLASAGFRIIPIRPNDKKPFLKGWPSLATKDPVLITRWWEADQACNIGIATGSGILVLDVDCKSGLDGYASLEQLEAREGVLPDTYRVNTPSGGMHFYFQVPVDLEIGNSASKLGPGLDVRGWGGYVVADGSSTEAGTYTVAGGTPDTLAKAPGWLLSLLEEGKPKLSAAGKRLLESCIVDMAGAHEGERNDTLNRCAYKLGQACAAEGLDRQEAAKRLYAAALSTGLEPAEIRATIASGMESGMQNPVAKVVSQEAAPSELDFVPLASIAEKPITWLWKGYIPRGCPTILGGNPGQGKSTLTFELAATVSRGGEWPDGSRSPAGSVLIISGEDSADTTIRPRVRVAGGNLERVFIYEKTYTIADIEILERASRHCGDLVLVIIDPITCFLGAGADGNSSSDIRGLLAPLAKFADRTGIAILLVSHLSKGASGGPAMLRITGSHAWAAAARSVLILAKNPTDEKQRVLALAKSNLAVEAESRTFTLLDAGGIPRVCWGGTCGVDVNELLDGEPAAPGSEMDECLTWLREYLPFGTERDAKDIYQASETEGYSRMTLNRASKILALEKVRLGFAKKWVWRRNHDN